MTSNDTDAETTEKLEKARQQFVPSEKQLALLKYQQERDYTGGAREVCAACGIGLRECYDWFKTLGCCLWWAHEIKQHRAKRARAIEQTEAEIA